MEMQFNISMDSHYGWIRSEIVASFSCEGVPALQNVLFYSRRRAIYHREGENSLPVTSHHCHHITQASQRNKCTNSEERPAIVGVTSVSDQSINNIVTVTRAAPIIPITAMTLDLPDTANDLCQSVRTSPDSLQGISGITFNMPRHQFQILTSFSISIHTRGSQTVWRGPRGSKSCLYQGHIYSELNIVVRKHIFW